MLNQSKEYTSWCNMKSRCYNKRRTSYYRYGGRGITVCDRWMNSFDNFLEDVGLAPSADHQLDRVDNDGNYEPNNVRWATRIEQCNNRSNAHIIQDEDGTFDTVRNIARKRNLNYKALWHQLNRQNLTLSECIRAQSIHTNRIVLTFDLLHDMYINKFMTTTEIGFKTGWGHCSVQRKIDEYGLHMSKSERRVTRNRRFINDKL